MDIVNEFFHKHYPADYDTSWEMDYCVGGPERRYTGEAGFGAKIFPHMVCADGFEMSVQGHWGAYSRPRGDFERHYASVEVGYPSEREELLMPYIDGDSDTDPTQTVCGYVPVDVVAVVIKKHGGLRG